MPFGTPISDEARKLKHELIYGTGVEPPVERLGLGPKEPDIWDALPALPLEFGIATLPLPRKMMRDIARK
jgi:hypothetical protein